MNSSWENQQQLIADQASIDYILSCSNRLTNPNNNNNNNNNNELKSILTRTGHITKVDYLNYKIKNEKSCSLDFISII